MTTPASVDVPHMSACSVRVAVYRIAQDHPSNAVSLVDLLPGGVGSRHEEFAWCGHGRQMVGWGVCARVEVTGPHAIRDAARWWDECRGGARVVWECDSQSEHGECPQGEYPHLPVAFASFGFSQRSEGFLVVPRVAVIELPPTPDDRSMWGRPWGGLGPARGPRFVVTAAVGEAPADPRVVGESLPGLPRQSASDGGGVCRGGAGCGEGEVRAELVTHPGRMTQDQWVDQVADLIGELKCGAAQKVVMSRDMLVRSTQVIDHRALLGELARLYPTTWAYSVGGLVGATPEMLAAMTGTHVASRVLAGTTAPGRGEELMGSAKDRAEHMFAVESVARALGPISQELRVPEGPTVLELPNVAHLATDVEATLTSGNLLDVIAALHPTAAVCGTPTALAYELLDRYEATQRGRYSGPVGWIDAAGEGEFGIALRCGQLSDDGREIRLFAGGGIMPDSRPEVELAETRAKMTPLLQALGLA